MRATRRAGRRGIAPRIIDGFLPPPPEDRSPLVGKTRRMLRLDIRWGMAIAVMVLARAPEASAQRLLEADGIELSGTARVVATAFVLERALQD